MKNPKLNTKETITWCPGCPNHLILEAAKKALSKFDQKSLAITTDIGCNSKIYDYLNVSGIYGLHGRSLITAIGIKLGNPKLNVISFQGDGGAYDEGIAHFVHACRRNNNVTLLVHDNQSFSLTTGQPTATTQQGYKSKASPQGEKYKPLNPIKLALASNATFVARANAMDIQGTAEIIEKAIRHQGFSFVEIMQKCLIFNKDMNDLDKLIYKTKDNKDKKKAEQLADEFDYNNKKGKIPVGVIYQS